MHKEINVFNFVLLVLETTQLKHVCQVARLIHFIMLIPKSINAYPHARLLMQISQLKLVYLNARHPLGYYLPII
jgi:hypothetical protein